MSDQLNFDFTSAPASGEDTDGVSSWRAQLNAEIEKLCISVGVPINIAAEVRLKQEIVLRGMVHLADETLWVDRKRDQIVLRVENVKFKLSDVESVVRI